MPSLLRGFSAPVILERATTPAERAFLIAHDGDPFNKWEAGTAQALATLARLAEDPGAAVDGDHLAALAAVADDRDLDPAFKALALALPSEDDAIAHVAASGGVPDPLALHQARRTLTAAIAAALGDRVERLHAENAVAGPYSPDAAAAGRRALRARALALATALDPEARAARAQFDAADNMTERMAALGLLVAHGEAERELAAFHADWAHDRLVVDKWFAVQGARTPPEAAAETVERLARAADFDWRNPNRFRALVGSFAAGNPAGFHRKDGAGYRLLVDWICRLDPVNPQVAARMATSLDTWWLFDAGRQRLIRAELERLAALPGLSDNTGEIVGRLLRAEPG